MPFSALQATIITAISEVITIIVGFGIIGESTAGQITTAAGTLVTLGFLIANAIIHHGESQQGVPPTKTLGRH